MYQSLAEALTDLTQELKAEGKKLKIIPARLADDRLLLLFPGTSPRRAQLLTERLQAAYNRRMTTKGASGHDFCTKVTGYGPKEKELAAFLRLVILNLLPDTENTENGLGAEQGFLMMLASHIAESYLLLEHAQSLALSDDISGLPNHRAADCSGEKINKSLKEQAPFSILFVDGDNLRQYNNISYQRELHDQKIREILASRAAGDFWPAGFRG